jgi:hypothetical protein
MNLVVLPIFDRPEFLSICLDYIQQADDAENWEYLFAQDRGGAQQNLDLIHKFQFKNYVITPEPQRYKLGKQSFNVLNALMAATSMNPDLIGYIEDDVFVGKDWFTFTKAIHEKEPGIFETILSNNVNSVDPLSTDINGYYVKSNTNVHQGIGNCFKGAILKSLIEPDFCHDYFSNPTLYVRQYYPESLLSYSFSEQDGLIRRIIEKNRLKIAFSHVPRCFHAGFYGYNRNPRINYRRLTFQQKIELIRDYSFNPEKLSGIVQAPNLVTDSLPVDLTIEHTGCKRIEL